MSPFPQSWFRAPLPKLDEYEGASYMEQKDKGIYVCWLCRTGRMNGADIAWSHVSGKKHSLRYDKLKTEWDNRLLEHWHASSSFRSRILGLGSDQWKWNVTNVHLNYLQYGSDSDLAQLNTMLLKYELMETLSLLELALWKQHILSNVFLTVQEARDYWVLEVGFDTKNISSSNG